MTVEFRFCNGDFIRQWSFWNGVVPIPGDTVLLALGDSRRAFRVVNRLIPDEDSYTIILYVEAV